MATSLGRFLRKLRIDREEILKNMAENIGVSIPFLSAVENGKKKMSEKCKNNLVKFYNLSDSQIKELNNALDEDREKVELNIKGVNSDSRDLAMCFARSFDTLDKETTKKIKSLLCKED